VVQGRVLILFVFSLSRGVHAEPFSSHALVWKRNATTWSRLWGWGIFKPRVQSAPALPPPPPDEIAPVVGVAEIAPPVGAAAAALTEAARWANISGAFEFDSTTGWVKLTTFCRAVGAPEGHTSRYVDHHKTVGKDKLWRLGAAQRVPRKFIDWKPLPGHSGGGHKQGGPLYGCPLFLKAVWRRYYM
jgi:hypothetical protein